MAQKRSLKLSGRKSGMTQLFDDDGNIVPCTVIQFEKNLVVQVKTKESDGYTAVQIGTEEITAKDPKKIVKKAKKPLKGHFDKNQVPPMKQLFECRIDDVETYEVGQEISLELFSDVKFVDVTGISKGKGFQGVMKLFNYSGGPASHGSKFHRRRGSQGMRSTPGRCFPGGKRPGVMGNKRITTQNLEIVKIINEEDKQVMIVKGAIPGAKGARVTVQAAVKEGKAA